MQARAAELGVDLTPAQADTLLAFRDLLAHWNRAVNLVSRRDVARLVPRHLLDSLSVAPWLGGAATLDLGTGAGLPGVPLAIAREDVHFTLIDTSERRIRFVRRAVRALGVGNAEALCADVRALPAERRFDTVVCRGVADAPTAWALAAPRLERGGRLVLMTRTGVGADRGSAGSGGADGGGEVPSGARLAGRHEVRIAGLERAHEVLVLVPAEEGGAP